MSAANGDEDDRYIRDAASERADDEDLYHRYSDNGDADDEDGDIEVAQFEGINVEIIWLMKTYTVYFSLYISSNFKWWLVAFVFKISVIRNRLQFSRNEYNFTFFLSRILFHCHPNQKFYTILKNSKTCEIFLLDSFLRCLRGKLNGYMVSIIFSLPN